MTNHEKIVASHVSKLHKSTQFANFIHQSAYPMRQLRILADFKREVWVK